MKVLIIPDVHLKPFMFKQAAELMERGIAKRSVCLMDIPDDWDKQFDISLYEETYDAAISFAKKYPDTAWCYGNHDLSYVWHKLETGYSPMAAYTVQKKLIDLKEVLPEGNLIKYVHRIDNVLFSHAGMSKDFVNLHVPKSQQFLQVVGHTPMETITKKKNVISCDVFSTYRDGKPIGTEEFLLLDTITWDYSMVNYGNY